MSHRFYLFFIVTALCASNTYAMENGLINANSFTQEGKEMMRKSIEIQMRIRRKCNVQTGLAAIYDSIERMGIESFVYDEKALWYTNVFLVRMLTNPVFAGLIMMGEMKRFNYDAKRLHEGVTYIAMRALTVNVLRELCPEYKAPDISPAQLSVMHLAVFEQIEIMRINEGLNVEDNIPKIAAMTLVEGYLASLNEQQHKNLMMQAIDHQRQYF